MGVYTRRWEAQTFRTFPDADANKPGLFRPGKNGKRPPGAENDRNCGVVARNYSMRNSRISKTVQVR